MSHIDTVKQIYESFGRGDIPAILNRLDDNVEWETQVPVEGVPWLQARRGKASIPAFFESLAPLKITRFEPYDFFESGNKVFVLVHFAAEHQGKSYTFPIEGHLWQFNAAGKVVKYDHVVDTAQMWRMANGR
jgi:ketosteroid isomerase-like protein